MTNGCVSFSFDDLKILSCTEKDEVILRCSIDFDEDGVLYVSRSMFVAMLNEWLNQKQALCKIWKGEFCGIGDVYVASEEITYKNEADMPWLAHYREEGEQEIQHVKGFVALDFDVDMEHG